MDMHYFPTTQSLNTSCIYITAKQRRRPVILTFLSRSLPLSIYIMYLSIHYVYILLPKDRDITMPSDFEISLSLYISCLYITVQKQSPRQRQGGRNAQ